MGNNSKLINLKILLIIQSLLLTVGIFPQSIEDMYDLDFASYAKSYRGDWTNGGAMVLFSIDSMEIVNGKYPLKISSRRTMRQGGIYDYKRKLLLSRTVILPSYGYGEICNVSINSKSENIENWKLKVRGLGESEEVLFSDSIYIESSMWKKSSISFSLHNEKALRIVIEFVDNHPKENQNAWIDKVDISINEKIINDVDVVDFYEDNHTFLDSRYITSLSLSDNRTLLNIPDIKDKQIIGLGESTHGSMEIKESCYQFMKALILEHDCKAVLFERAPDMCLKWDLYVNGKIPREIELDIEKEVKCFFDDAGLFMDFLNWLRDYNETVHSKIHIFGFDTFAQPHLFFFDYFTLLLSEKDSLPYLRLLKDKKYQEIIDYAMTDSRLQSILGTESFDYFLFLLDESIRSPTITNGDNDNREIDMWNRADKIIQLYMKEDNKVVLHAHSSHTNKASDFFFDVVDKPSMGSYIYRKYGDNYFSIGFQAGEGAYTQDETGVFSETIEDSLQMPIIASFEYSALKINNPYFYYPADKLPDGISSIRAVGRERKKLNQFFFCSIKKRFDGIVFVRNSTQLHDIEKYPFFYTSGLIQFKAKRQREIMEDIQ